MSSPRRARAAVEAALWDIECALLFGRDVHDAAAALTAAAAKLDATEAGRADERRRRFAHALAAHSAGDRVELDAYAREHGLAGVVAHKSGKGARFWRLVTESFPRHINYVYLLQIDEHIVLWDCGSGMGRARQMLIDRIDIAHTHLGAPKLDDINVLFVSHGHFDHFGDAAWWKERTKAPLWIHELDARVLEHFPERTILTGRDMGIFLRAGGVPEEESRALVRMYLGGKDVYGSVAVDRRIEHHNMLFHAGDVDRARVIHTPGHCPGHVCLRVDDVLLVGDQVLSPVSPHLSPQVLHPQTGLERYLFGLARLGREDGVSLILPAHYDPIPSLQVRIREIAEEHVDKLRTTKDVCRAGATIQDVAHVLFPHVDGYNVLLALLEAGTHVEYLHQLGQLVVKNVDSLADDPTRPAIYSSTDVEVRAPALA